MGFFAVGNLHSIYIYFSVLLLEFCDINMVSHIPYTTREHHMGRHNLVHSNSSSNDIGRASYKFLMKKITKIKIAVENKPQRSSVSNSFQRGEWFYILVSWLVWGCFFLWILGFLCLFIFLQEFNNICIIYYLFIHDLTNLVIWKQCILLTIVGALAIYVFEQLELNWENKTNEAGKSN